jgi:prophage maintenance system killer protein
MGSALLFLKANGVDVDNFDEAQLYDAMIAIAEKRLDKAGLAAVFREQLKA